MQYLDEDWNPTNKYNGSKNWIAGLTSQDGRILVMMPHPERVWLNVAKNVPWTKLLPLFENAYKYFIGIK
jgi:phosphoribosylformylglycinamidine (FGAM) synthase-like amidotransferase family enzyme